MTTDTRTDQDPDLVAREVVDAMAARDDASAHLGIEILEIRRGYARLSMKVVPWMLQGHRVCHGGLLFTLADTAMAYASNSYNESHLALSANFDFVRPAQDGDVLTAEATESNRTRKTGMYRVTVSNQDGKLIGEFRGRTFGVPGKVAENVGD